MSDLADKRAGEVAPYRKKCYSGDSLREIAFPLGGIGTGCISLSGQGRLIDWEIFNRPNKGFRPRHTFFSIWMQQGNAKPVFRVLEGPSVPQHDRNSTRYDFSGAAPAFGFSAGLARMESVEFNSEFPFAEMLYHHHLIPLEITMTAFNPFIPLNADDSSLPVAIFQVQVVNPTAERIAATVALNIENVIGYPEIGGGRAIWQDVGRCRGILMETAKHPQTSPRFGTLALATSWREVTYQVPWHRGIWFDDLQYFCNTFVSTGNFDNRCDSTCAAENSTDVSSLGLKVHLEPGAQATLPFILAWHNPWYEHYWEPLPGCRRPDSEHSSWLNNYATKFTHAGDVAHDVSDRLETLQSGSRAFQQALYASTLPTDVINAVACNLSILKTPTCLRLTDGSFYGFEGSFDKAGSCEGTCTHVWNYAQALPYLFPDLERSIHRNLYGNCVRDEDGHMQFRMNLPLGTKAEHQFHAAVDGQLGGVVKLYRDWQISGDNDYLRELWPQVRKTLEYAWKAWDADRDGMIDGVHHNTYDIEFHGAEPLANSFYLAALKAAEIIANFLGETEHAREYARLFTSGRHKMDTLLFNDEYYQQVLPDPDVVKYQFGAGCLSDQLIGQWYADMTGLGDLTATEHIKKALCSIFRYNWKSSFVDFNNPQRVYAMNDEKGLVLCSWPHGKRPRFPFVYSDEVWYGIEYQVACCLIYHDFINEGLSIVAGIRERHAGWNRNPWNEVECGNYYARSLASYALLLALSGFHYSAPKRSLTFAPRISHTRFQCFFCVNSGWGMFRQDATAEGGWDISISLEQGELKLNELHLNLPSQPGAIECRSGVTTIAARMCHKGQKLWITFAEGIVIKVNTPLKVDLSGA